MYGRIGIADKKPEVNSPNPVPLIRRKTESSPSMNSPVDHILFLQRTIGNQAVARLIKSGDLQAKLRIGQPGDVYEQEADRVAEQVMRMPDVSEAKDTRIQRKCPKCLRGLLGEDKKDEKLQAKQTPGQIPEVNTKVEANINALKGGGQPLPESTRAFFEPRFGQDLSQVRVHADAQAAESVLAVNATAYTAGHNIVFDRGRFSPGTHEGRRLIAHELNHVMQQTGGDGVGGYKSNEKRRLAIHLSSAHEHEAVQTALHANASSIFRKPKKKDLEAERIAKLETDYAAATAKTDWKEAARLLNAFKEGDIEKKLRKLTGTDQAEIRWAAPQAMPGFSDRIVKAVDAVNADAKRIASIIDKYENALKTPDWGTAAKALNGFTDVDIVARVKRLKLAQLAALKAGALVVMPGSSDRVVKPIEARQGKEARAVAVGENSALAHLQRLATKAASETDGAAFQKAVLEFKKQLQIDLESVPASSPLPDNLKIVVQALLLWDVDKGDQWGEGRWDSKDFTPSAGDYAVVPASQNKCNAYLAEVIFKAIGVVHQGHLKEGMKAKDPRAWFPYRASEWGNSRFTIPNFPVVSPPIRGDILCTGGHVGIYLGSYAGKDIYISARDDAVGLFAQSEQFKHGIQIKYTKPGLYRRYTP